MKRTIIFILCFVQWVGLSILYAHMFTKDSVPVSLYFIGGLYIVYFGVLLDERLFK